MRRRQDCWCDRAPTSTPRIATACLRCPSPRTNGNANLVKLLLDAGANANASLPGGETVLMTAARAGNLESVKALLARGANPNAKERREQTALMWAAAEGHAAVVRALIEGGADDPRHAQVRVHAVVLRRARGPHRCGACAARGRRERERDAAALQEPGRTGGHEPVGKGTSPLLMAVENGHFELAVALVDAGADPNDQRTGFTPLHAVTWVRKPDASDSGDPPPIGSGRLTSLQFVRALVERGANVNARLDKGAPKPPDIVDAARDGRRDAVPDGGRPGGRPLDA